MRTRCAGLGLPLTLLLVVSAPALADWSPSGVRLCQSGCPGGQARLATDGQGGAFIVWGDERVFSNELDVYLQRITAAGDIAPGWPVEGLPVCAIPAYQDPFAISSDGGTGVLIVWYDHRDAALTGQDLYAQHVLGDGTFAPGWPQYGAPVSRGPDYQD